LRKKNTIMVSDQSINNDMGKKRNSASGIGEIFSLIIARIEKKFHLLLLFLL